MHNKITPKTVQLRHIFELTLRNIADRNHILRFAINAMCISRTKNSLFKSQEFEFNDYCFKYKFLCTIFNES